MERAQRFSRFPKTALLAALLVALASGLSARAQTSGGFSIRAVIPSNQVDTRQTYFDLRMSPGQTQTLEVIITNNRPEPLDARLRLGPATTGRNGLIVYTVPPETATPAQTTLLDVASLETEQVIVPPGGSSRVKINLQMPEKPIDGILLGGLAVTGNEADGDESAQGVSLRNKITYVVAIKLTESDQTAPADFDLVEVRPELVNFRTAVVATLQNKAPRIVKNMEVRARIMPRDYDTVLREMTHTEAEMAPQTNGDFVIDWENQPLNPGAYRIHMTADYKGEVWEWTREFTIGGEVAEDLNHGAVGMTRDFTGLYLGLGALMLTLVWFAAYRTGRRSRRGEA